MDAAPLLPKSPSTYSIMTRLASLLFLSATSLWANHESSSNINIPFSISVPPTSPSPRFDLLFASNGRASASIFRAASLIHPLLSPSPILFPRKPLRQISLQLIIPPFNLSSQPTASASSRFTIFLSAHISPDAVAAALAKGVAEALLWDGGGAAPAELMEALADYLGAKARGVPLGYGREEEGGSCLGEAGFVDYCERRRPGFVARLNRGMRDGWSEEAVDQALGFPASVACAEYRRRRGVVVGGE